MANDTNTVNTDLIRGHVDTIILNSLLERDRYGYEILDLIERLSEGRYIIKQPTLYGCLKRLEKQGFISSYFGAENETGGGRRRYYTLTEKGLDTLTQDQREWEFSRTIVDRLLSDRQIDLKTAQAPFDPSELRPATRRVRVYDNPEIPVLSTEAKSATESNTGKSAEGEIEERGQDLSHAPASTETHSTEEGGLTSEPTIENPAEKAEEVSPSSSEAPLRTYVVAPVEQPSAPVVINFFGGVFPPGEEKKEEPESPLPPLSSLDNFETHSESASQTPRSEQNEGLASESAKNGMQNRFMSTWEQMKIEEERANREWEAQKAANPDVIPFWDASRSLDEEPLSEPKEEKESDPQKSESAPLSYIPAESTPFTPILPPETKQDAPLSSPVRTTQEDMRNPSPDSDTNCNVSEPVAMETSEYAPSQMFGSEHETPNTDVPAYVYVPYADAEPISSSRDSREDVLMRARREEAFNKLYGPDPVPKNEPSPQETEAEEQARRQQQAVQNESMRRLQMGEYQEAYVPQPELRDGQPVIPPEMYQSAAPIVQDDIQNSPYRDKFDDLYAESITTGPEMLSPDEAVAATALNGASSEDVVIRRHFQDLKHSLSEEGFRLRMYNKTNSAHYYYGNYFYANKLLRDATIFTYLIALIEIVIFLIVRKAFGFSVGTLLGVAGVLLLFPIGATVAWGTNPTKRMKARFAFPQALINSLIIFILAFAVTTIVFLLAPSLQGFQNPQIYVFYLLEANVPIGVTIYYLLYRSNRYHLKH